MIGTRGALMLATAVLLCVVRTLAGQTSNAPGHPSFSSTWAPGDQKLGDFLFAHGLGTVPGRGRLTIEQRADRLTVTITMPDEDLDPRLSAEGSYYQTIVYRLPPASRRTGGYGAGGPLPDRTPSWDGDWLVLPCQQPTERPAVLRYRLDGDRLDLAFRVQLTNGRVNTATEWFTRVK